MTVWEAFWLGVLQGLAEFLPISSSGHLALLQAAFGIDGERVLTFTVLLHVGTLIAVFFVYRKTIVGLLRELLLLVQDVFTGKGVQPNLNKTRRLGIMIIIATIPAAVAGVLANDMVERMFASMSAIGVCLIVTGTLLFAAERLAASPALAKRTAEGGKKPQGFLGALVVGLFQAAALLPGISRSGSTLVGGLLWGFKKEFALMFAFLISIPSVLGAVLLEIPTALKEGLGEGMLAPSIVGVLASAVFGFLAIKVMIRLVSGKKLYIFSIYTWALGAVILAAFGALGFGQ